MLSECLGDVCLVAASASVSKWLPGDEAIMAWSWKRHCASLVQWLV